MTPRPFYRSRLFWLGLPGLVFLLWTWVNSNSILWFLYLPEGSISSSGGKLLWEEHRSDQLHWVHVDLGRGDVEVKAPGGLVALPGGRPIFSGYTAGPPWTFASIRWRAKEQSWFPEARWRAEEINHDTSYRLISLPYWLLTSGYVAGWLLTLAWWQRRKSCLLKLHTAP